MAVKPALRRARQVLLAGAVVSAIGVVIAATFQPSAGGVILLVGWAAAIYGLHSYGRTPS